MKITSVSKETWDINPLSFWSFILILIGVILILMVALY